MPGWAAESNGNLRMFFGSPDDFFGWINTMVAPTALQYGYRVTVEPVPKDAVSVDRA